KRCFLSIVLPFSYKSRKYSFSNSTFMFEIYLNTKIKFTFLIHKLSELFFSFVFFDSIPLGSVPGMCKLLSIVLNCTTAKHGSSPVFYFCKNEILHCTVGKPSNSLVIYL